jgi:hypothetical protein
MADITNQINSLNAQIADLVAALYNHDGSEKADNLFAGGATEKASIKANIIECLNARTNLQNSNNEEYSNNQNNQSNQASTTSPTTQANTEPTTSNNSEPTAEDNLATAISNIANGPVTTESAKANYLSILQEQKNDLLTQGQEIINKGANLSEEDKLTLNSLRSKLTALDTRIQNYNTDFETKYDATTFAKSDAKITNQELKMQSIAQDIEELKSKMANNKLAQSKYQRVIDKKIIKLDNLQQHKAMIQNKQRSIILKKEQKLNLYNNLAYEIAQKKDLVQAKRLANEDLSNMFGGNPLSKAQWLYYSLDAAILETTLNKLHKKAVKVDAKQTRKTALKRTDVAKLRQSFRDKLNGINTNVNAAPTNAYAR